MVGLPAEGVNEIYELQTAVLLGLQVPFGFEELSGEHAAAGRSGAASAGRART